MVFLVQLVLDFLCNKALGVGFEPNPHILEFILLAQICKSWLESNSNPDSEEY
jgi:hypothetical protein